ncbi:MAG: DUF4830 domain-containing protein [Clostridia bacterium]|nr:DUF4830 domain-containing protein [Clostridia bacterium]MBR5283766.1 DUF4830 domain-containing protein [Clostridia bacterium]
MMIYTVKFSKKKAVAILLAMAIVIAAVILAAGQKETEPAQTTASVVKIKSDADCLSYIASLGYTVETVPVERKEVTIPIEFDEVYEEYNRIQQSCGFDLTSYRGKKVTLYTYTVTNYPGQADVRCDLLVHRSKIIGGNLYTTAIDGFMHGLKPAEG